MSDDDKPKRPSKIWGDTERVNVGAQSRRTPALGLPASTSAKPPPAAPREVHDEITPAVVFVADVRRGLEEAREAAERAGMIVDGETVIRIVAERFHAHALNLEYRIANKLTYVSQGGILVDGQVPAAGHHPLHEHEARLNKVENISTDLVGVEGGKAGGRVDAVEKKLASWRALAVTAVLAAVGSIGSAVTVALKFADERGAMREWRMRTDRDLLDAKAERDELRRDLAEFMRGRRQPYRADPDRDTSGATPQPPGVTP